MSQVHPHSRVTKEPIKAEIKSWIWKTELREYIN